MSYDHIAIIKKIAALLFVSPAIFFVAAVLFASFDNLSLAETWAILASIIIGTLGLPIWMMVAAWEMFRLPRKGDRWVRLLSLLIIAIIPIYRWIGSQFADVICSEMIDPITHQPSQECLERAQTLSWPEIALIVFYAGIFFVTFLRPKLEGQHND